MEYIKVKLAEPLVQQLLSIPESGMGWHKLYVYLVGPFPDKQVFRIQAVILNSEYMIWPMSLGDPADYKVSRLIEITNHNTHQKWQRTSQV